MQVNAIWSLWVACRTTLLWIGLYGKPVGKINCGLCFVGDLGRKLTFRVYLDGLGYKVNGSLEYECGLKVKVFVDCIMWITWNPRSMWIRLFRWLIGSSNGGKGSKY